MNAAKSALAPIKDLELLEGDFENRRLPAKLVRQRLLHFLEEARLPMWQASWGQKLVRLPEAPTSFGQVLVYCSTERLRFYVREGAVRRSSETDPLSTALARIHFCAHVSQGQSVERRAARAKLPSTTSNLPSWRKGEYSETILQCWSTCSEKAFM